MERNTISASYTEDSRFGLRSAPVGAKRTSTGRPAPCARNFYAEWLDGEGATFIRCERPVRIRLLQGSVPRGHCSEKENRFTITEQAEEMPVKRRNTTMTYTMICKQHRHEEKRFWFHQERRFVMPVSELQIIHERKVLRL